MLKVEPPEATRALTDRLYITSCHHETYAIPAIRSLRASSLSHSIVIRDSSFPPQPSMPSPCPSRRETALALLNARVDFERVQAADYSTQGFKLDRMRELLHRLGNPQEGMPVVHVAGTKGKGSTSAMVAAMLQAAGYRVGLFTSPHLERLEERIAVDGRSVSEDELLELVERVRPAVEEMDRHGVPGDPTTNSPTFFEVVTAMGLLYFRRRGVDGAVLEVGLGGRLDSTNVCQARVSVITSISYDHMLQLGDTLEQIAREKAGIIKPGVPVVCGVTDDAPRQVIQSVCRDQGAPLVQYDVDFRFTYHPPRHLEQAPSLGTLDFEFRSGQETRVSRGISLGLLGRHQAANAAVALAVIEQLRQQGWTVPDAAIRAGLESLTWPARVELMERTPALVLDAAHNVATVQARVECLDESYGAARRHLLFATTRDKDVRGMLSVLLARFDRVVLTQYSTNRRAMSAAELASLARELTGRDFPFYPLLADAWRAVLQDAFPSDLICITGSFFLAAEIRWLWAS